MRCKPGDLVILLRAGYEPCKPLVGQIHRVGKRSESFANSWLFDPPVYVGRYEVSWNDDDLQPIRDPGADTTDETLTWLPVPSREEVTQ